MRRNFDFRLSRVSFRDPRVAARAILGALLFLNIAAALFLFRPWGGSAEDLKRQMATLSDQVRQRRATVARVKELAGKVEKARDEGDTFMKKYMLDRRSAYSAVVGEMDRAAKEAGIKAKESQFSVEPVEGSDTLEVLTISAGFEGPYANLTKFINLLDRSPRFLIIESVQAAPQQQGPTINVAIKLSVFVRNEG